MKLEYCIGYADFGIDLFDELELSKILYQYYNTTHIFDFTAKLTHQTNVNIEDYKTTVLEYNKLYLTKNKDQELSLVLITTQKECQLCKFHRKKVVVCDNHVVFHDLHERGIKRGFACSKNLELSSVSDVYYQLPFLPHNLK